MNSFQAEQTRVPVSSVIPIALASVFPFANFNGVQSQCLTAFQTDNNLVVSAPTGSGKTVLFEMAICRELHRRSSVSGSDVTIGKCVYLAPIKALCSEKAADWSSKFEQLGLTVCLLAGDAADEEEKFGGSVRAALLNADIVLSTPEKFDAVTRNHTGSIGQSFVATVSLLLIDEVHHLADSRGSVLEAVVARMLLCSDALKMTSDRNLNTMPAKNLRVLAASATIPNLEQVAVWLRVPDVNHCKAFAESYRPVPLETNVLGYKCRNQWKFNEYLSARCFQVVTRYSSQKPALVFCPSRKSCFAAAKVFVDEMHSKGPATTVNHGNVLTQPLSMSERSELLDMSSQCSNRTIAELIRHGVAVHHAEVSDDDRLLVEDMFRRRLIRVMFCTTTLSAGVNLPARLVVILGTTLYKSGSMVEINKNQVTQMTGRAGRPQYDTKGVAVIMTAMPNVSLYERICAGKHDMVNSQLEQRLAEHVNAEISRSVVADVPSAVLWLKSTFLYTQKRQTMRPQQLEKATKDIVMRILGDLAEYNIIEYDDEGFGVLPQNASHLMAQYYVSFATMKIFVKEGSEATSEADLLRILAKSAELVESLFLRRSEKKQLNELTSLLRYPVRTKVQTVEEKVYILLQCGLTINGYDLVANDFNLRTETRKLSHTAKRLALTLARYLLERERPACFTSCMAVLEVSRGIEAGTWWSGGSVIRQLSGVGPVAAKKLISGGVHSMNDLARMDPRTIEQLLKKNLPFGNELLHQLDVMPRFYARVEQVSQREDTGEKDGGCSQVSMVFQIHVSLRSWIAGTAASRQRHRGFVLVGSHSQPVSFFEKFTIADEEERTLQATVYARKKRSSRWIDFFVGAEEFCGCDFKHRIHLPGSDQQAPLAAQQEEEMGEKGVSDGSQGNDVLDLTGPEHNDSQDGGQVRPKTVLKKKNHSQNSACKHTCKNKQRCKHICCKFVASGNRLATQGAAASQATKKALTADRAVDRGLSTAEGHDSCTTTLQNLDEMRRRARPLTASLPLKRLRDSGSASTTAPAFAGTRLAAFFQQSSTPSGNSHVQKPRVASLHGALLPSASPPRGTQRLSTAFRPASQVHPTPEIAREDSYDSIFALLVDQNDADVERKLQMDRKFNLQSHLEKQMGEKQMHQPDDCELTMPIDEDSVPVPEDSNQTKDSVLPRRDGEADHRRLRGFRHAFL